MYLQSAEIHNFRGIRHLNIDFEKETSVLIGENAWGKSSLLYALFMILGRGEDNLCTFSAEDLYVPIKLACDDCEQVADNATNALESVSKEGAAPATPSQAQASSSNTAQAPNKKPSASLTQNPTNAKYLHDNGLEGIAPFKIINTKDYQRCYYSVPNPNGIGKTLRIVDLPKSKNTNVNDVEPFYASRNKHAYRNHKNQRPNKQAHSERAFNRALAAFSEIDEIDNYYRNLAASGQKKVNYANVPAHLRTNKNEKKRKLNKLLDGIQESMFEEAQYEKKLPLYYQQSSQDRIERAQNVLSSPDKLNEEARQSAQEDIKFFSSDVYQDEAEQIVIDLIFCETHYGVLNRISRFDCLKPIAYLGDDGRYRIHYRVTGHYEKEANTNEANSQSKTITSEPKFVTKHELLRENGKPFENALPLIRELIILNPLLRLRDRRMYRPSDADQTVNEVCENASSMGIDCPEQNELNSETANKNITANADAASISSISHFFSDLTTEDELNSSKVSNMIEVLNTIASKYLTNYQSNSLIFQQAQQLQSRPRTAREIVSHPVSITSLAELKNAIADEKPSSSKFLFSLLAGALMMSKGQRVIDEYSRPILILEDIEARFHPTLLLNFWSILHALPIQKIVTTNSDQLIGAMSLHNVRRLCKQYYDVRCFKVRDRAFSPEEERKIAFHIRMSRPNALFARCWVLVEGETEVWMLNEIASVLGINLGCHGIKLIEFAQCGLAPIIKLARQLGISYHVLTDGDDAGRHYASTVREFTGSRNLSEHLSVMPHLDIEHYLYTSGFADVYQKAAGLEPKPISHRHAQEIMSELEQDGYISPIYAPANLLETSSHTNINKSEESSDNACSSANVIEHSHTSTDELADNKSASFEEESVHDDKHEPNLQESVISLMNLDSLSSDLKLKGRGLQKPRSLNHNLDSIIKSVRNFDFGEHSDNIFKIIRRGRVQGNSKKADLFTPEELTKGDLNAFNGYMNGLIHDMPRPTNKLTTKQSKLKKSLDAVYQLMKEQVEVNEHNAAQRLANKKHGKAASAKHAPHNKLTHHERRDTKVEANKPNAPAPKPHISAMEQDLNDSQEKPINLEALFGKKAQEQHQAKELSVDKEVEQDAKKNLAKLTGKSARDNKINEPNASHEQVAADDLATPQENDSNANLITASSTSHESEVAEILSGTSKAKPKAKGHPKDQLNAERLMEMKAKTSAAMVYESDATKVKNYERITGKATNALYGALNDEALSRKGLSVNKVIDAAIHKKTKPGMAILVSEAMQERGPDSVPILFRTMFRKIKRMAQNEFGIEQAGSIFQLKRSLSAQN